MKLTYSRKGDYLFPDLFLEPQEPVSLGKYGRLRKTYLKENRQGLYNELLLEGKLNPHLAEIEETAYDCFDRLTAQMAQAKKNIRYRGSLQNYLIDTGDEVILVDTGLPAGTPEEVPDENSPIFTGKDICSYMEAFAALGYMPEQVTKILLTHKHNDHSGELKPFPNAKICINADEIGAEELKGLSKRSSPSSRIITGLCCERRWNAFASKNACLVGHLSGRFQQDDGAVGLGGNIQWQGRDCEPLPGVISFF